MWLRLGGRALVTVALGGAILSPLLRAPGWDSFPISSYPMFSSELGRMKDLAHVVLVGTDGSHVPAPPAMIGTTEPMIATAIVRGHIARGTSSALCADVAARVLPTRTDVVAVEVVESHFDVHRYIGETRAPVWRIVHARCDVKR